MFKDFFLNGKLTTNIQSIILQYENIVTKVNKLSYYTFLKTIGEEMNDSRPNLRSDTKKEI